MALFASVSEGRSQVSTKSPREAELERKWGADFAFSGISTFAHLPHIKCLLQPEYEYDIAIIGLPFDTAVTYRPGARFGPRAIRQGSARQAPYRGFNARAGINPYTSWAHIVDCGDVPINPFDNELALRQMTEAYIELGHRPSARNSAWKEPPKLVSLGGDHSIVLPALRALNKIYGQPIAVLHFDAHLDTWDPAKYPSAWTSVQTEFTHGSMFWMASNEGLILNGSSVHGGLRTRLSGKDFADYDDDDRQGFLRILADDIDDIGVKGVIDMIYGKIGRETPVYLSIDIDVLDPAHAPATGTPEAGGWTSRELIRILRGLEELNVVGADLVEVSPSYDGADEQTAMTAAQIVYEVITSIVKRGIDRPEKRPGKSEL